MAYVTVTLEMPRKQIAKLYRYCADRLITVDEFTEDLFCWVAEHPDEASAWYKALKRRNPDEEKSEHAGDQ